MFLGTLSGIFEAGGCGGVSGLVYGDLGSHALNTGGLRGLKHSLHGALWGTSSQGACGRTLSVVSTHMEVSEVAADTLASVYGAPTLGGLGHPGA